MLSLEGQQFDSPSSIKHADKTIEMLFITEMDGMWIQEKYFLQ